MVLVFTKFHGVMAIPLRHRLSVSVLGSLWVLSENWLLFWGYYPDRINQYNLVPGSVSKIALKCLIILYFTSAQCNWGLRRLKVKKNIKVEVKNRKNRKIRSQRSLVVLHLRSLIGGRIRRASSVVSHVCDPNDIRQVFDMYHYARYIREWRSYHLICVREAVHRERHKEGADR